MTRSCLPLALFVALAAGCRAPAPASSPRTAPRASLGTAEQLERIAVLAREVESLRCRAVRPTSDAAVRRDALALDRERRDLNHSGLLESGVARASMRAEVDRPLDELLRTLGAPAGPDPVRTDPLALD